MGRWSWVLGAGLLLCVLLSLVGLLWLLSPIEAVAWTAPPPEPERWQPELLSARRMPLEDGLGPEDVEVDSRGRVYLGLEDGRILRQQGQRWEELADTGGRPLGLHWSTDGQLLVADALRGLLAVDPRSGAQRRLATHCGETALGFTDDVDVGPDGTVWFTDASLRHPQPEWKLDLLESRPTGRLCALAPGEEQAREVLAGLYFANGVAVEPEGRFVLINETSRYRVRRLWLEGDRAGEDEVWIDNLPGFPDGISTGSGGRYWIALASPRNPLVDALAPWPRLREIVASLPDALQPAPERTARLLGVDARGEVRVDLMAWGDPPIAVVTSVQERGGRLYLGSLLDAAWAWLPLPPAD